jgi:hypothetical protein
MKMGAVLPPILRCTGKIDSPGSRRGAPCGSLKYLTTLIQLNMAQIEYRE